jgi:hypothetical protein
MIRDTADPHGAAMVDGRRSSSRCGKAVPRALSSELLEESSTACATLWWGLPAGLRWPCRWERFFVPPCQLFVDFGF